MSAFDAIATSGASAAALWLFTAVTPRESPRVGAAEATQAHRADERGGGSPWALVIEETSVGAASGRAGNLAAATSVTDVVFTPAKATWHTSYSQDPAEMLLTEFHDGVSMLTGWSTLAL